MRKTRADIIIAVLVAVIIFGVAASADTANTTPESRPQQKSTGNPRSFAGRVNNTWYVAPLAGDHSKADLVNGIRWTLEQIGKANADLVLVGDHIYKLGASLEIPANVNFCPKRGAIVRPDKNATLTVNNLSVGTGPWQWIDPSLGSSVVFGRAGTQRILIDWFGKDERAFTAAVSACPAGSTLLMLKTYKFGKGVTLNKAINLDMGEDGIVQYTGTGAALKITGGSWNKYRIRVTRAVDWSIDSIGVTISSTKNCEFDIQRVTGFKCGIYLHEPNLRGVAYNKFNLNYIVNNQVGIYIHSEGKGWVIYNIFYGGRFGISKGVGVGQDRYGIKINAAGKNHSGENYFYSQNFEIDGFDNTSKSIALSLHGKARFNQMYLVRCEGLDYILQAFDEAYQNVVNANVFSSSGTNRLMSSYVQDNSNHPGTNILQWANLGNTPHFGLKDVFPAAAFHKILIANYRSGDETRFLIPGFSVCDATTGAFGVDSNRIEHYRDRIKIHNGVGLGRVVDTSYVKDFWLKHTYFAPEPEDKFIIICFDENDHRLLGTKPYYVTGTSQSSNAILTAASTNDFGGGYYLGSYYELAQLHFHDAVKTAWIGVCNSKRQGKITLKQFSTMCDAAVPTPGSWPGYPETKYSNTTRGELVATAPPVGGLLSRGDRIWNLDATPGAPPGWYVTKRITAAAKGSGHPADKNIVVDDATGISDGDIVGVLLDNGQWHWSRVSGKPLGNSVTMTPAVPAERNLRNGAKVVVFTLRAMADLTK
jgi:hypothetical protein